jgi:hypothetical protein
MKKYQNPAKMMMISKQVRLSRPEVFFLKLAFLIAKTTPDSYFNEFNLQD